jgi:hypothetical protein
VEGISGGITSGVTYFGIVSGSRVPPGSGAAAAVPELDADTAKRAASANGKTFHPDFVNKVIFLLTPLGNPAPPLPGRGGEEPGENTRLVLSGSSD